MLHSYFIKYSVSGYSFISESEYIIYTNRKILTQTHIYKVQDEMFNWYKKTHTHGTGISIKSISYLGEVSEQEANDDEYAIYLPIIL